MATLTLGLSLAIAGLVVLINRMNKSKAEAMAKDAELHNQVVKTRIEISAGSRPKSTNGSGPSKNRGGYRKLKAANKILTGYREILAGPVDRNTYSSRR